MMINTSNIYNMDCVEAMHCIKDQSIDMIFCDLPYNVTHNAWD